MNKSNEKPAETTELYSVIIDGQPFAVEASSHEEAVKKAEKQAKAQEVGDGSSIRA